MNWDGPNTDGEAGGYSDFFRSRNWQDHRRRVHFQIMWMENADAFITPELGDGNSAVLWAQRHRDGARRVRAISPVNYDITPARAGAE